MKKRNERTKERALERELEAGIPEQIAIRPFFSRFHLEITGLVLSYIHTLLSQNA